MGHPILQKSGNSCKPIAKPCDNDSKQPTKPIDPCRRNNGNRQRTKQRIANKRGKADRCIGTEK